MNTDEILLTVAVLAAAVGLVFGATAFALWLRAKRGRGLDGTVYGLRAGRRYVVVQSFTDYHGGRFEAGERLTFKGHNFVPYHGGHVLTFEERNVYLQEEDQADILGRLWAFIEPARQ